MNGLTFKRGIHPPDGKSMTQDKPIVTIAPEPKALMVFPVIQHLGAPCNPIVEVGQKVLRGEMIAESEAFVSSPIHSSVSGVVKEIAPRLTPNGIVCNAIIIENDGENTEYHEDRSLMDYSKFTRAEIITKINEAGIVGLGGAGFPTHIKLNPPPDKKIDYILINAAECEPYLTTDHRVMLEDTDSFLKGVQIILSLFPDAKAVIGIETNKMDAIEKIEAIVANMDRISVARLVPKYPQGSEKQLIFACTGREVPSGGLPADIGAIVDNVDTVVAIYRALAKNRPLMRRIITVSGGACQQPGNYKVRLGMSYQDLMNAIGGFKAQPYKIISGGPMMGVTMFDLNVPFIKTSSSILCYTEAEGKLPPERNCIRCAKCVEHCPMGLMPLELNANVLHNEDDSFLKNHGIDCIECGSCSYVCPAKRHLAQSIRARKRELLAKRKR